MVQGKNSDENKMNKNITLVGTSLKSNWNIVKIEAEIDTSNVWPLSVLVQASGNVSVLPVCIKYQPSYITVWAVLI